MPELATDMDIKLEHLRPVVGRAGLVLYGELKLNFRPVPQGKDTYQFPLHVPIRSTLLCY